MWKNYLKVALRTLRRRPGYTAINVGGLAVGLAACLLIGLWVRHELSYDDFHERADRIYRVLHEINVPEQQTTTWGTPAPLAPALEQALPAVEEAVRTWDWAPVVQHDRQKFVEPGFLWADAGFFEVFSFPILRGEAALNRPGTAVLTKAMVQKYFPNEDPIGQTLRVQELTVEVTGVMANVPENSSLQVDFVGSMKTATPPASWDIDNFKTYVLLAGGYTKQEVQPQVRKIVQANLPRPEEKPGNAFIAHLQPITGIHLGTGVSVEIDSPSNILYVYLFGALAVFVLLLACVNFTNLATARSAERAREVGMRKALGARREQLAGQFLGEALLLSAAATVLALLLARAGLPLLNALSGKALSLGTALASPYALGLPGLALVVGVVAGAYPALALSGFEPVEVLRGSITKGKRGRRFRQVLVAFQFTVSIAILVGTAVIYQQLRFMRSEGLGFNGENVVVVKRTETMEKQDLRTFMQEVEQLPGVRGAASSLSLPGTFFPKTTWETTDPNSESHKMDFSFPGYDYVQTLGIDIAAGRSLSRTRVDSSAVLLNETAARRFGWTPQEAVGKEITRGRGEMTVIGVMEDFHYKSLYQEIEPLALFLYRPGWQQRFVVARVEPESVPQTLEAIRGRWEQFSELPFQYSFLASDLAAQYRAENQLAKVFTVFAGLAILLACLGLFGLATFAAERRKKEIAVRKTFGATAAQIVALLSKDFFKLVGIGFAIATPVAYFAMQRWLEGFAYRVELGPLVFVAAGALALVVALAATGAQALRAARTNPAQALRDE